MSSKDLLKISLVLTLVASAGSAFAGTITGAVVIGTSSFTPSANVTIIAASSNDAYAARSGHLNGNREYFGNNTDSKLWFTTKATGSAITGTVNATDPHPTGWSSL